MGLHRWLLILFLSVALAPGCGGKRPAADGVLTVVVHWNDALQPGVARVESLRLEVGDGGDVIRHPSSRAAEGVGQVLDRPPDGSDSRATFAVPCHTDRGDAVTTAAVVRTRAYAATHAAGFPTATFMSAIGVLPGQQVSLTFVTAGEVQRIDCLALGRKPGPGDTFFLIAMPRDALGNVCLAPVTWTTLTPSTALTTEGGQVAALRPGDAWFLATEPRSGAQQYLVVKVEEEDDDDEDDPWSNRGLRGNARHSLHPTTTHSDRCTLRRSGIALFRKRSQAWIG